MASVWISARSTSTGERRFIVQFRIGGRESRVRHGGSFQTKRDAEARLKWITVELAGMRVPDLGALSREPEPVETLRELAERWRASRIDVVEATRDVHRKALVHVLSEYGERDPASLTPQEIGAWIGALANTYQRGTLEKVIAALRMVLDFGDVRPNPARDDRVKLPRRARMEIAPPTAREVVALIEGAAPKYRLALIVLEATGMRVGELEKLRWGDVDETEGHWRVAREHDKTGRGRWVQVPPDVFAAVVALVPREDRERDGLVFPHLTQAKLRTDMVRACRAAGIATYSPHDLRHRRISIWHAQGVPLKQVGERVGQANLSTTADVYTHSIADAEIDRERVLRAARVQH